jgi:hypothetical protein
VFWLWYCLSMSFGYGIVSMCFGYGIVCLCLVAMVFTTSDYPPWYL